MNRAIDILGAGSRERGKDDHFKRRDLYDPVREMDAMLAGGPPPAALGDHAAHIMAHVQHATTTAWATAGKAENFALRTHIAGHLNEWLIEDQPYTAGPKSVADAMDIARSQDPLGPGM